MHSVTVVTSSKGRLSSLKKTLKSMVDTSYRVVVVDYDCPDGTASWIESQPDLRFVKIVSAGSRPLFNAATARNLGLAAVETDWVLFIDADVSVIDTKRLWRFLETIPAQPTQPAFYTHKQPCGCLMGTYLVSQASIKLVHGYDELMNKHGAGYEEIELYQRLMRAGIENHVFPTDTPLFFHHEHAGRTTHYDIKDRIMSDRLSSFYYAIKHDILRHYDIKTTELPLSYREKLMDGCHQAFEALVSYAESVKLDVLLPAIDFPNATFGRTMTYTLKFKGNLSQLDSHTA